MKSNVILLMASIAGVQTIELSAMDLPAIHIKKDPSVKLYQNMEKGPMNPNWFYSGLPPHIRPNELHQNRKWQEAAREYDNVKNQYMEFYTKDGIYGGFYEITPQEIEYTKNMARLNLAICCMAQRKPSEHWASFDALIGVAKEKQIAGKLELLRDKLVRVRTDKGIGIGDIFHFMEAANILKKRTGCYVVFSVPDFLRSTLLSVATAYDLGLVGVSEPQPQIDYETHIIGLLGHLLLHPHEVAPDRVVLTAPERAMIAVAQQIEPILAQGKQLMVGYAGDKNRQATLIGGKQLPRDPSKHGRSLDSIGFKSLLRTYKDLVLIDCGKDESCSIALDEDQKNQYIKIASEEQAFDTPIALAWFMNDNPNVVGFGADTGVTNVFIRALTKDAQRRMSLIIPNGSKNIGEYDMRMEGEGPTYTQMISNCRVYKCEDPSQQAVVMHQAYQDMMGKGSVMHHPIQ